MKLTFYGHMKWSDHVCYLTRYIDNESAGIQPLVYNLIAHRNEYSLSFHTRTTHDDDERMIVFTDFVWSQSNDILLSASLDGSSRLWNVAEGSCVRTVVDPTQGAQVLSCLFQPLNNNWFVVSLFPNRWR